MKAYLAEAGDADFRFMRDSLPSLECTGAPYTLQELMPERPEEIEVLSLTAYSRCTKEHLDQMPILRLIATRSTGFDHIDGEECARRGIAVTNVPGYGSCTVAEHTFALILCLSRKVHRAYLRTLEGNYDIRSLMGSDLCGKTLGLIGVGKIGRKIIQIAKGFDMEVLGHDPYAGVDLSIEYGFQLAPFDEVLASSDVIVVCCPLTPQTRHLIDRAAFGKMKRGVLFINAARGPIMDTDALAWALQEGIVAGAGLDVMEEEHLMSEDVILGAMVQGPPERRALLGENLALVRHPNVLATPHMAYYTKEALHRILEITVENIQAYLDGKPKALCSLPGQLLSA